MTKTTEENLSKGTKPVLTSANQNRLRSRVDHNGACNLTAQTVGGKPVGVRSLYVLRIVGF